MLNVVIVDDETIALQYTKTLLGKFADVKVVACYSNPVLALQEISMNSEIDVAFFDISMPEINGLELAILLQERRPEIRVVFLTAYDSYAISAFDINAVDYLLKPINNERLTKTIERLKRIVGIKEINAAAKTTAAANDKKGRSKIRIECLGRFSIVADGEELKWQSGKTRELVALLAEKSRHGMTGAAIIEELWPESNTMNGNTSLYTTIHRARKLLEPYGEHLKIVNKNKYYSLAISDCYCELVEMEKMVLVNGIADNVAPELALKLRSWFSGNAYLEHEGWEWSAYKREWLEKNLPSRLLKMWTKK